MGSARSALSVLITADAATGVWSYARTLAGALASHGVLVHLAVLGPPASDEQRRDLSEVPGLELHERPYRLEWMPASWRDVARAGAWLLELERAIGPDVVHLNCFCLGALPWRAPTVLTAHGCRQARMRAVRGEQRTPRHDRYRAAVARGLRAASVVVAPTSAMLRELERLYGWQTRRLRVPHGTEPRPPVSAAKAGLVLASARVWSERKNLATLAHAARGLSVPVYVAGAPPAPTAAPVDGLHLLGVVPPDQLDRWRAHAEIFVQPSYYEPFGIDALEAARAGCALVLADLDGLREIWGESAIYVSPDDPYELRAVVEELHRDFGCRTRLVRLARERASRLTARRMGERYLTIYRQLAAASQRELYEVS